MAYIMSMMGAMNKNSGVNQSVVVPFYNPWKASSRDKNFLANQTVAQSIAGAYTAFPKYSHLPFSFIKNFEPPNPMGICDVSVVSEHILDVVEHYSEKGINYEKTKNNGMNPITVNVVGRDFNGSNLGTNEELRDELLNIRTTFSNSFSNTKAFPLKKDECTYLKIVTVIRQSFPMPNSFLPVPQTFRTGLITIAPIQVNPETYVDGENYLDGKMCSNDFVDTLTTIECIFQLALWKQHPVLILPPFGHNDTDNNPVDDIIKIYNYCIYKYGHAFKKIIIAIPKFYPKEILTRYQKNIVKPLEMVVDIDKKYEKEEVKKQVLKSQQFNKSNQSNQPNQSNQSNKKTEPKFTQEQMEFMQNMMANMLNNSNNK